jgi:uncharacterized MAPEG superfamily protein
MTMTTELTILTWLMVLATSLWIPYIIGVNRHPPVGTNPFIRPPDGSQQPDWVRRADRAHMNLLEQGMPFAALVLVAHAAGVSSAATVWAAAIFLGLRVIHAVGMISGRLLFPLRSIVFTLGWICTLVIAAEVLRLA